MRVAKYPGLFRLIENDFSNNAYENLDFPAVGKNIRRSRTATKRKQQERERKLCRSVVNRVLAETTNVEERICKEKSVR